MQRKILSVTGIILLSVVFYSCSSNPEEGLLKSYFHADALNDVTTMSTMALEPISLDADKWDIVKAEEEVIETAKLFELNKMELDLKKKLEDHIAPTVESDDALYTAKEKLASARTRAAKAAAQKEVDAAQAKYDEEREIHRELQKNYNEAKAEAAREEEIASFSLDAGDLPNIRDFTGDVHYREVDVRTEGKSGVRNHKIYIRKYILKDESINYTYRGRWIITKFEALT